MPDPQPALKTKRLVIGHVSVCRGCCCGDTLRGKPEVPVEWLKREWRHRGLPKNVHLTISGCLGPCDLSNVVSISSTAGTVWLGSLHEFRNYAALLKWASASRGAGHLLPLPEELTEFRFNPFRTENSLALSETSE
jgi:hypothetical protein